MSTAAVLISLLVFCAVAAVIYSLPYLLRGSVLGWLGREQESSRLALQDLKVGNISASQVLMATGVGVVLVFLALWSFSGSLLVALLGGGAALYAPRLVFGHLQDHRRAQVDEQLPAALDQLASFSRNLSPIKAFEEVQRSAPNPIAQEFGLIVRDYNLGSDLSTAIVAARDRIGSKSFTLAASALVVNQEKGGNLVEALERISTALKEVWRLEQKIITGSAEARKGVRVISVIPILLFLMISALQPDIIDGLTSSLLGWALVAIAVVMYLIALAWFRKLLDIKV